MKTGNFPAKVNARRQGALDRLNTQEKVYEGLSHNSTIDRKNLVAKITSSDVARATRTKQPGNRKK